MGYLRADFCTVWLCWRKHRSTGGCSNADIKGHVAPVIVSILQNTPLLLEAYAYGGRVGAARASQSEHCEITPKLREPTSPPVGQASLRKKQGEVRESVNHCQLWYGMARARGKNLRALIRAGLIFAHTTV
jgi:hypothetical protein